MGYDDNPANVARDVGVPFHAGVLRPYLDKG